MEREKYILSGDVVCVWGGRPVGGGFMGLGTVPVGQVPYRPHIRTYKATARHVPEDSNLIRT